MLILVFNVVMNTLRLSNLSCILLLFIKPFTQQAYTIDRFYSFYSQINYYLLHLAHKKMIYKNSCVKILFHFAAVLLCFAHRPIMSKMLQLLHFYALVNTFFCSITFCCATKCSKMLLLITNYNILLTNG